MVTFPLFAFNNVEIHHSKCFSIKSKICHLGILAYFDVETAVVFNSYVISKWQIEHRVILNIYKVFRQTKI